MTFKINYLLWTIVLFIIEVIIATYLKDWFFVRAYIGDVLVVMLIYTFLLTFFNICNRGSLIIGIFLFSVLVEIAQWFHFADKLGFELGSIPYVIIGNSFSWWDIICYGAGCLLLWGKLKVRKN